MQLLASKNQAGIMNHETDCRRAENLGTWLEHET
jgi:hypothetical protein